MNYEKVTYRGFNVDIDYDESPMNPFEDWDGSPALWAKYGRFNDGKDYSDGGIQRFLASKLTDGQIIRHQKIISTMVDGIYLEEHDSKDERIECIRDAIQDCSILEELAWVCEKFKIPHYYGTSRGHSQGDWADILLVYTDDVIKESGCEDVKLQWEQCESSFELYGNLQCGNVYGFDWEHGGCWGFFGDAGLKDIKESYESEIDWHIDREVKKHLAKLKAEIKGGCPMEKRSVMPKFE